MNSAVPSMYRNAVKELMESKAMRRLAGFQNRERQLLPAGSEPDYAPQKHSSPFSLGYTTTTNASYPSCTADAHTCGVHMKPRSCRRRPTTWAQPRSAVPTEIPLTFHSASVPSWRSVTSTPRKAVIWCRESWASLWSFPQEQRSSSRPQFSHITIRRFRKEKPGIPSPNMLQDLSFPTSIME